MDRYLSLFSGGMGGDLGMQHLVGMECVGYVEWEEYCQKLIRQRQEDGLIDRAPIFGDIRAFISEGYAASYQGLVDVITGGFPCQAWSTAARGRNKSSRDLWPETLECINIIRPGKILLENVSKKAIRRARTDLEASGYSCRGAEIPAAALGAAIERERQWLFAEPNHKEQPVGRIYDEVAFITKIEKVACWDKDIAGTLGIFSRRSNRVDRNRAIGNIQVPIVAATAWEILNDR